MKRVIAAAALLLAGLGPAQAQEEVTIAQLSAQGKVLLSSHFIEVTEQVIMIMGTVEGGPEYICRTRPRGGSGYDTCRKFE